MSDIPRADTARWTRAASRPPAGPHPLAAVLGDLGHRAARGGVERGIALEVVLQLQPEAQIVRPPGIAARVQRQAVSRLLAPLAGRTAPGDSRRFPGCPGHTARRRVSRAWATLTGLPTWSLNSASMAPA